MVSKNHSSGERQPSIAETSTAKNLTEEKAPSSPTFAKTPEAVSTLSRAFGFRYLDGGHFPISGELLKKEKGRRPPWVPRGGGSGGFVFPGELERFGQFQGQLGIVLRIWSILNQTHLAPAPWLGSGRQSFGGSKANGIKCSETHRPLRAGVPRTGVGRRGVIQGFLAGLQNAPGGGSVSAPRTFPRKNLETVASILGQQ